MTDEQSPIKETGGAGGGHEAGNIGRRRRVLWLHTQPEHYFNCMLDDLESGAAYRVKGMEWAGPVERFEYTAVFAQRGPGWYTDNAQPRVARTVFLRTKPEMDKEGVAGFRTRVHIDWRKDLGQAFGGDMAFDAAIVSGYAWRTQRELMRACKAKGIPVAMWSDSNLRSQRGSGLKWRIKMGLKKQFLRGVIDSADMLLTANRLGVAYWRFFGAPRKKIIVSPCYSDYARIDVANERPRAEVLGAIGLRAEERILFSAARLVAAKGLDLTIGAFLRSGLHRMGWTYVIAGAGPLEQELKALAGEELGKAIRFVGFQQPAMNLALMAQAEMLALPSRYEPHGIVVGEALAAGTPVLASDVVGAAPDLIARGVDGMIFRSEDTADLAEKMAVLGDEARIRAMKAAARPAFEGWYRKTSPALFIPQIVKTMLGGT